MCWVMPPASPAATWSRGWRRAASFAVVDVAHDGDHRRALDEVVVVVVVLDLSSASSAARTNSTLAELLGEDLDRLVGQGPGERDHLAHAHELLDDVGNRHAEVLGDVLDRGAGVDPHQIGAGHDVLGGERGRDLFEDLATAPATALAPRRLRGRRTAGRHGLRAAGATRTAARGLRVDDDAAPAAPGPPEAAPGRGPPRGGLRGWDFVSSRVGRLTGARAER